MDEEARTAEHVRLLAIGYYVYAGLACLGSCGGLFYVGLGTFLGKAMREMPTRPGQEKPPEAFVDLFQWLFTGIGAVFFVAALTIALVSFLSARWISQHRNRTFSLVVAALICLSVPFGTTLGVFTFIVLLRPEAERLYERAAGAAP